MRLPREKVNDIISGALYSSLLVSEKDPRKTIIDLLNEIIEDSGVPKNIILFT